MKVKTPTKTRPHRNFADEIDIIVHGYGPRVRVVQLWRRLDQKQNEWTYIGRVPPEMCEIELIGQRFGGASTAPNSSATGTANAARKSTWSR